MANAYVQYMIQKSLSDIDMTLDEIPHDIHLNLKKTPKPKNDDCLTTNDDFDIMFAQNTINSLLNHFKSSQTIPCEAIMSISPQDSKCVRERILVVKKEKDLVSFVDYRFVTRGLKRSHKGQIKFIDQNEMTKPSWLRKSTLNMQKNVEKNDKIVVEKQQNGKLLINISEDEQQPPISNKKHGRINTKTDAEVLNFDYKYMPHYNQTNICFMHTEANFWDNIKSKIHSKPLLNQIKEKQDNVPLKAQPLKKITEGRGRKRIKTWQQTNDVTIKQHSNVIHHLNIEDSCLWQQISMLISKNTSSYFDQDDKFTESTLSECLTLLDQLTQDYLIFIDDDKIRIHPSEIKSLFLSKSRNSYIMSINQHHFDQKTSIKKDKCHVCDHFKRNGTMKYVIVYTSYLLTKIMPIDHSNNVLKLFNVTSN